MPRAACIPALKKSWCISDVNRTVTLCRLPLIVHMHTEFAVFFLHFIYPRQSSAHSARAQRGCWFSCRGRIIVLIFHPLPYKHVSHWQFRPKWAERDFLQSSISTSFWALSFLTMREHFPRSNLHRQSCTAALKRFLTPWPSNGNVQDVKILWRCNLQRDLATCTWTLPTFQKLQMGGVAEIGIYFKKMMRSILRFLFLGCWMHNILNLVFNVLYMPEVVQEGWFAWDWKRLAGCYEYGGGRRK